MHEEGRETDPERLPPGWQVARLACSPIEGVQIVGFRAASPVTLDVPVRAKPVFTVVIDCANESVEVGPDTVASGGVVAGMVPGHIRVRAPHVDCVEIQLSPLVATSVLGVVAREFVGGVVGLEDLWGLDALDLRAQMAGSASWEARFDLVSGFLRRRAPALPSPDAEVAVTWQRIVTSGGRLRVGDLAAACGWSRARLWSRFEAQIGLPPKRAAMLVRADAAFRQLAEGARITDVAASCGYADQSHLHRDLVEFSGSTPRVFANEPSWSIDAAAWGGPGEQSFKIT